MSYRYAKLDTSGAPVLLREFQAEPHPSDVPADEVHVTEDATWAAYQAKVHATAFGKVPS